MSKLVVIMRITDRCNLNCAYCYVDQAIRRSSTLRIPIDSFARFYEQTLRGQFNHVTLVWHGGEPTLVGANYLDEVISMQRSYLAPGVTASNSIQTNATAITPQMIELFKRHGVGVGVSIDAPPDVHSSLRVGWNGGSSLSRVLDQVAILQANDINFGAICVLNKSNYRRAHEIYDFFSSIGVSYRFNPFYRDEATSVSAANDLFITPEQYAEALLVTYDRYVNDPQCAIDVSDLQEMVGSMFKGFSSSCLFAGQCQDYVGVLPNGDMYLCDMFYREDQRVGNIRDFTAASFRQSRPVRMILTRPSQLQRSACSGCEWW